MLRLLLKQKNMTLYRLEKETGLPHSTLNDLYHERVDMTKVSAFTINTIASVLNISMDELYNFLTYKDLSLIVCDNEFDLFKSNVCHNIKRLNYEKFIEMYSDNNEIRRLYEENKYLESTYLLSMLDTLSLLNGMELKEEFEDIRQTSFNKLVVPESIYYLLKNRIIKLEDVIKESLPEFLKHNILESEIDSVY
ncbi:MAG: helix-turn-helix transcriptional regulator [Bacilli bacterium]|nr:helix-turn-helix transcriptional regulator [Bacilli bacterium]